MIKDDGKTTLPDFEAIAKNVMSYVIDMSYYDATRLITHEMRAYFEQGYNLGKRHQIDEFVKQRTEYIAL